MPNLPTKRVDQSIALAFILTLFLPGLSIATKGEVQTHNNLVLNQSEQLIGEVKNGLSTLSDTLKKTLQEFVKAEQKFINCDAQLGKTVMNNANYAKCSIDAAQESRRVSRVVRKTLQTLEQTLSGYEKKTRQDIKDNQASLEKEKAILKDDSTRSERLNATAQELIRTIEQGDPDAPLTSEQSYLIHELVNKQVSNQHIKAIHKNGIAQIEMLINQRIEVAALFENLKYNVKLSVGRAKHRETEASEFIRVTRLYGVNRALLIESREIADILTDSLPEIQTVLDSGQSYSHALNNLNSGTNPVKPVLNDSKQSRGNALILLKSLLNKDIQDTQEEAHEDA